jgi:hypothetical protein
MKEIFDSVIRRKVSKLIKTIGVDISEIVIKLPLEDEIYDTIELVNNDIFLHMFVQDLEYITNFDDLSDNDKLEVYKILFIYL